MNGQQTLSVWLVASLSIIQSTVVIAAPMSTAFVYRGRLGEGGHPANGLYDLRFSLYDTLANGTLIDFQMMWGSWAEQFAWRLEMVSKQPCVRSLSKLNGLLRRNTD